MPSRSREKEVALSPKAVQSLFSYDEVTGLLSWACPPRRGVSIGPAGVRNSDGYLIQATYQQNNRNRGCRKDNVTGIKGVTLNKAAGTFTAKIIVDKKRTTLGTFRALEDAAAARQEAELRIFGEFSPLYKEAA